MVNRTPTPSKLPGRLGQCTRHAGFPKGECVIFKGTTVVGTGRPFYYREAMGQGVLLMGPSDGPVAEEEEDDEEERQAEPDAVDAQASNALSAQDEGVLQELLNRKITEAEARQQLSEDDIIVPNVPENILWIKNGNKYLNVPLSSHWSPYRRAANGDLYFWHRSEGGANAPEAQRDPNITRWQLVPASLRTQMEIALARAGLPISHDKKTAIDRNDETHDKALLKRFLNEGILTARPNFKSPRLIFGAPPLQIWTRRGMHHQCTAAGRPAPLGGNHYMSRVKLIDGHFFHQELDKRWKRTWAPFPSADLHGFCDKDGKPRESSFGEDSEDLDGEDEEDYDPNDDSPRSARQQQSASLGSQPEVAGHRARIQILATEMREQNFPENQIEDHIQAGNFPDGQRIKRMLRALEVGPHAAEKRPAPIEHPNVQIISDDSPARSSSVYGSDKENAPPQGGQAVSGDAAAKSSSVYGSDKENAPPQEAPRAAAVTPSVSELTASPAAARSDKYAQRLRLWAGPRTALSKLDPAQLQRLSKLPQAWRPGKRAPRRGVRQEVPQPARGGDDDGNNSPDYRPSPPPPSAPPKGSPKKGGPKRKRDDKDKDEPRRLPARRGTRRTPAEVDQIGSNKETEEVMVADKDNEHRPAKRTRHTVTMATTVDVPPTDEEPATTATSSGARKRKHTPDPLATVITQPTNPLLASIALAKATVQELKTLKAQNPVPERASKRLRTTRGSTQRRRDSDEFVDDQGAEAAKEDEQLDEEVQPEEVSGELEEELREPRAPAKNKKGKAAGKGGKSGKGTAKTSKPTGKAPATKKKPDPKTKVTKPKAASKLKPILKKKAPPAVTTTTTPTRRTTRRTAGLEQPGSVSVSETLTRTTKPKIKLKLAPRPQTPPTRRSPRLILRGPTLVESIENPATGAARSPPTKDADNDADSLPDYRSPTPRATATTRADADLPDTSSPNPRRSGTGDTIPDDEAYLTAAERRARKVVWAGLTADELIAKSKKKAEDATGKKHVTWEKKVVELLSGENMELAANASARSPSSEAVSPKTTRATGRVRSESEASSDAGVLVKEGDMDWGMATTKTEKNGKAKTTGGGVEEGPEGKEKQEEKEKEGDRDEDAGKKSIWSLWR